MNRHFEDAEYYLRRAVENVKKGVETEVEPVVGRVRRLVGQEPNSDPDRLDELKEELADVTERIEGEVRDFGEQARAKADDYRRKDAA